jgi:hypothetical protein
MRRESVWLGCLLGLALASGVAAARPEAGSLHQQLLDLADRQQKDRRARLAQVKTRSDLEGLQRSLREKLLRSLGGPPEGKEVPIVMLSVLLAVPRTPLYDRLKAEGRLLHRDFDGHERAHYVGTAGGTNFHPGHMTREELKRGQQALCRRLYEPEAFLARLMGNVSR